MLVRIDVCVCMVPSYPTQSVQTGRRDSLTFSKFALLCLAAPMLCSSIVRVSGLPKKSKIKTWS